MIGLVVGLMIRLMIMMMKLSVVMIVVVFAGSWLMVLLTIQLIQALTGRNTNGVQRQIRRTNHSMSRAVHRAL